jgi:hypothetical protein
VTICDLRSPELSCAAQSLVAPRADAFYVSPTAAYLWTEASPFGRERTPGDSSSSMLTRFPLDGSAPRALRVSGSPEGEHSFREESDGSLRVFVRGNERERGATGGEKAYPSYAALLRVSPSEFGGGARAALSTEYRTLPTVQGNSIENQFMGKWLIYGGGFTDIYMSESMFSSTLIGVRIDGGGPLRLRLTHTVDRIEAIGSVAFAMGSSYKRRFVVSGMNLNAQRASASDFELAYPPRGYLELHASSRHEDGAGGSILGISVQRHLGGNPSDSNPPAMPRASTSVLYLRMAQGRLKKVGAIAARTEISADDSTDACRGSCDNWYANARAIFVRERIFALLGYELVEVRIKRGHLIEQQRLDFSPKPAQPEPN